MQGPTVQPHPSPTTNRASKKREGHQTSKNWLSALPPWKPKWRARGACWVARAAAWRAEGRTGGTRGNVRAV
eukprot:3844084-Alexandrium_andersonii.AAC.1